MQKQYKKFRLSELFGPAKLGKYHNPSTLVADKAGYEYICASSANNGVNKDLPRVTGKNLTLSSPNIIAWGKQCPVFTYHKDPCVTSQGMYYYELGDLSEEQALYVITALTHACGSLYSYTNCLIGSKADTLEVYLPIMNKVVPDWSKLEALLSSCRVGGYVDMSKIDTSSWKEFKLGDILRKIDVNKLPYRISDLPKAPTDGYTLPAISSGGSNQGITCYVPEQGATILQNVISIASNGDGYAFWQPDKFTIIQDAYAVERADGEPFTENAALFLVAGIQKILNQSFSWTNKSGWNKVKECSLTLPYKTKDVPDWDYMQERIAELEQERIAELEQERIAELEQYLITTGLNDYELTDEDKEVLADKRILKDFVLDNLFDKPKLGWKADRVFKKSADVSTEYTDEFMLPLVNAKNGNNGVMYYGRESDFDYVEGGIDIVNDGAVSTGNVYPHPQRVGVLYNAYIITLKNKMINQEVFEYLSCSIQKTIKHLFSYSDKASWDKVKEKAISLPVQTDSSGTPIIDSTHKYHKEGYLPDFKYMEKYIRAIEKLVIKDVVRFKDDMIKKTKELCDAQKGNTDGEAA